MEVEAPAIEASRYASSASAAWPAASEGRALEATCFASA